MVRPRPLLLFVTGLLAAELAALLWWFARPSDPRATPSVTKVQIAGASQSRPPRLRHRTSPPSTPTPAPGVGMRPAGGATAGDRAAPHPEGGPGPEREPYVENDEAFPPPTPQELARQQALQQRLADLAKGQTGVDVVFADCGGGACVGRVATRGPEPMRAFLAAARRANLRVEGRVRERLTAFNGRLYEVDLTASPAAAPVGP